MDQKGLKLSIAQRLQLINTLNRLPLSNLLAIEVAIKIPEEVLPGLRAAQGERVASLLRYLESSSGPGLNVLLEALECTGIEPFNTESVKSPPGYKDRSGVFSLTLKANFDEANRETVRGLLDEIQDVVQDYSIKINRISPGSIKVELEGYLATLKVLQTKIESGEVTDFLDLKVQKTEIIKQVEPSKGLCLQFADLSEADLSTVDLAEANLNKANLVQANLSGANLSGANLSEADLSGANFSKAILIGATLIGANLSGAQLVEANLNEADLSETTLIGANLTSACLMNTDLGGANLSGADLSKADLSEADLSFTNLSEANFRETNLRGSNLREADLRGSDISLANNHNQATNLGLAKVDTAKPSHAEFRTKLSSDISCEPPLFEYPQPQDVLDQAIEEILGKENPAAYSIFTAVERIVRQFKLDVEAHGLLFDAYLRGKKALQQGKEIRNPQAWLRGAAYNIAREKSRKRKRVRTYSPEVIDVLFSDKGSLPLEGAILEEEVLAAVKAMQKLQAEKPDIFDLIHQRVVEERSWQEIQSTYASTNEGKTISEATLRQRYSRGRKYLRSIFHRVTSSA